MKNGWIYWISEPDGGVLNLCKCTNYPKEDSNQINLDEIILFFQNWGRTRKNWKDSEMMEILITNLNRKNKKSMLKLSGSVTLSENRLKIFKNKLTSQC